MDCVASTLHTTSEHGVSSITTSDAHTSAAISRLNWRPSRFKWTRPFRRKTKSGFWACAITFQTHSAISKGRAVEETILGLHGPCKWKVHVVSKGRRPTINLPQATSQTESSVLSYW